MARLQVILLAVAMAAVPLIVAVSSSPGQAHGGELQVGAAKVSIVPTPENSEDGQGNVHLGGFGLGAVRLSSGVGDPGLWVRAIVFDGGHEAIGVAVLDTQGHFAAYQDAWGETGADAIRERVDEATGGALAFQGIVVQSTHTHAGPDDTGVWGALPKAYMEQLADATVQALTTAYDQRQAADLVYGTSQARGMIGSQFFQAPNDRVDGRIKVVQATAEADGSVIGTLAIVSTHGTVMGSANTLIHPDWYGITASHLDTSEGGVAVISPGTLGRSQPRDTHGETDLEEVRDYGTRMAMRIQAAIGTADRLLAEDVQAAQRFLLEPAHNPILFTLNDGGQTACLAWEAGVAPAEACAPIARDNTPPYRAGQVLGTWVSALRIGDLALVTAPGEVYPQMAFDLENATDTVDVAVLGMGNDQLGYLITPLEGYHQPVLGTVYEPSCHPDADKLTDPDCYGAIENDNWAFNVAPMIGTHVTCSGIWVAEEAGVPLTEDIPPICLGYAEEPTGPVGGLR